jgi:hypothetical protein
MTRHLRYGNARTGSHGWGLNPTLGGCAHLPLSCDWQDDGHHMARGHGALFTAAGAVGAGGVLVATVSALNAGTVNALGVFLGGLAALVSASVALLALLRRKDPAEYFAEGVRYGQEHGDDDEVVDDRPRRRRRR